MAEKREEVMIYVAKRLGTVQVSAVWNRLRPDGSSEAIELEALPGMNITNSRECALAGLRADLEEYARACLEAVRVIDVGQVVEMP